MKLQRPFNNHSHLNIYLFFIILIIYSISSNNNNNNNNNILIQALDINNDNNSNNNSISNILSTYTYENTNVYFNSTLNIDKSISISNCNIYIDQSPIFGSNNPIITIESSNVFVRTYPFVFSPDQFNLVNCSISFGAEVGNGIFDLPIFTLDDAFFSAVKNIPSISLSAVSMLQVFDNIAPQLLQDTTFIVNDKAKLHFLKSGRQPSNVVMSHVSIHINSTQSEFYIETNVYLRSGTIYLKDDSIIDISPSGHIHLEDNSSIKGGSVNGSIIKLGDGKISNSNLNSNISNSLRSTLSSSSSSSSSSPILSNLLIIGNGEISTGNNLILSNTTLGSLDKPYNITINSDLQLENNSIISIFISNNTNSKYNILKSSMIIVKDDSSMIRVNVNMTSFTSKYSVDVIQFYTITNDGDNHDDGGGEDINFDLDNVEIYDINNGDQQQCRFDIDITSNDTLRIHYRNNNFNCERDGGLGVGSITAVAIGCAILLVSIIALVIFKYRKARITVMFRSSSIDEENGGLEMTRSVSTLRLFIGGKLKDVDEY